MPFVSGRSGNPNGRPKTGAALAAKIRELGGEDGAVYLAELHRLATEHPSGKVRLSALAVLLDRGYGKVPETVEVQETVVRQQWDYARLTTEELETMIPIMEKLEADSPAVPAKSG